MTQEEVVRELVLLRERLKRLHRLLACALVATVGVVAMGQSAGEKSAAKLSAQKFVVTDREGREVAIFGTGPDVGGVGIAVLGLDGKQRMSFVRDTVGEGRLTLFGDEGRLYLSSDTISLWARGEAEDSIVSNRANLLVRNGRVDLTLSGEKSALGTWMWVDSTGTGGLRIEDKDGKPVLLIPKQ